jgi:hypothetical protein
MQSTTDEVLIGRIANGDRLAMHVLFAYRRTTHPAIAAAASNSVSSLCPTTFLPIASPP